MAQTQYKQYPDMNTVIARGRLTADPQVRDIGSGHAATFTVAATSRAKNADGSLLTNFYRVTAWGGTGETCAKFLKKGSQIIIVGELSIRVYKDTNGADRTSLDVNLDKFFFDGGSKSSDAETESGSAVSAASMAAPVDNSEDEGLPF